MTLPLANLIATWFMIGVVTYVQFVHYPMFRHWPRERFGEVEAEHQRRTGSVVMLPMLLELVTAILMVLDESSRWRIFALIILLLIWLVTFAMLVPRHERLRTRGFDELTWRALLRWNGLRMMLWWLRGLLFLMSDHI